MCDFKPGDEVVCVDDRPSVNGCPQVQLNAVYIVDTMDVTKFATLDFTPGLGVRLKGLYYPDINAAGHRPFHASDRFRKVQRRDLNAWLKTAAKFEEPKRGRVSA